MQKRGRHHLYIERFCKVLYPYDPEYPAQAEGSPIESYRDNLWVFVFDGEGKILIDQEANSSCLTSSVSTKCGEISYMYNSHDTVFLDEKNLLLPTKSRWYEKIYQHYRVENNEASLIHTFNEDIYRPMSCDFLTRNKLLMHAGKLYNFLEDRFLEQPNFDSILIPGICHTFDCLEKSFKRMNIDYRAILNAIMDEMKNSNLMLGYKEINAQKEDVTRTYFTFAFLDGEVTILKKLFYRSYYDDELKMIDASNETYDYVINSLKIDLQYRIDKELKERSTKKVMEYKEREEKTSKTKSLVRSIAELKK